MATSTNLQTPTLTLTLPSTRQIAYTIYGSPLCPTSQVIFYTHSTPSSRLEASILSSPAQSLNLTLISLDRPSIGLSTPLPSRQISSFHLDIEALASYLQVTKFSILAFGGGLPYALSCLHLLSPQTLQAITIISGVWREEMGGLQGMGFMKPFQGMMSKGISKLAAKSLEDSFSGEGEGWEENCRKDMEARSLVEREDLRGKEMEVLWGPRREAFRQGRKGVAEEFAVGAGEWGFELGNLGGGEKVVVWHGGVDENVKVGLVRGVVGGLRGARLEVLEERGHFGILAGEGRRVLEELKGRMAEKM